MCIKKPGCARSRREEPCRRAPRPPQHCRAHHARSPARRRPRAVAGRSRWCCSSYAAFGLSWIAVTPLLGELGRDLHAGAAKLGLLNTAVAVAKVVAPLGTGALALRLGLRRTLALGTAAIA